jgi:hypothetical protein
MPGCGLRLPHLANIHDLLCSPIHQQTAAHCPGLSPAGDDKSRAQQVEQATKMLLALGHTPTGGGGGCQWRGEEGGSTGGRGSAGAGSCFARYAC